MNVLGIIFIIIRLTVKYLSGILDTTDTIFVSDNNIYEHKKLQGEGAKVCK